MESKNARTLFQVETKVFNRLLPGLLVTHEGEWMVIKGEEYVGPFKSGVKAYEIAMKKFGIGDFMMIQILPEQPIHYVYSEEQLKQLSKFSRAYEKRAIHPTRLGGVNRY